LQFISEIERNFHLRFKVYQRPTRHCEDAQIVNNMIDMMDVFLIRLPPYFYYDLSPARRISLCAGFYT